MGVSGVGKSTVGAALATRLAYRFVEGDDLHSEQDRAQLAAGHPLTDEERVPWLRAVGAAMAAAVREGGGVVAACSALRRPYRDLLRRDVPDLFVVALRGDRALLALRVTTRHHPFMPASLLGSQLATLEPLQPDERGLTVDVATPLDEVLDGIVDAVSGP
jgi:gluconokinase